MESFKKFEFEKEPKEITYDKSKSLKLSNEFRFYHNKLKFRKNLNDLQYLFQEYLKNSLVAAGIRDSYIKVEYTENYLFMILTTPEIIKNTNQIIKEFVEKDPGKGCYYMKCTEDWFLVFAKNLKGIRAGIEKSHKMLKQVLKLYFERGKFDEYIKIPSFSLYDCID